VSSGTLNLAQPTNLQFIYKRKSLQQIKISPYLQKFRQIKQAKMSAQCWHNMRPST